MFEIDKSWARMSVMSVDVSTKSSGWAYYGVWKESPLQSELRCGVFQPQSDYVYERLQLMHRDFEMISDCFRPDLLIIESGFADTNGAGIPIQENKSAGVTMKLAEARGAVMSAFKCPVIQIGNTEWKRGIGIVTMEDLAREKVKQKVHEIASKIWEIVLPITKCQGKATYDESDAAAMLAYVLRDLKYSGA